MPAQVCFDSSTFYTVLIISCAIFLYGLSAPVSPAVKEIQTTKYVITPPPGPISGRMFVRDYELERFRHPMIPPLRRGPFNLGPGGLRHRQYGYGTGVYHQMGFLHNPENVDQAMPLMGRRLHSQQYEYYTFHHNNPDIKIPIKITGDKEINDGDNVTVNTYAKPFQAKIYELDTPRYVPF